MAEAGTPPARLLLALLGEQVELGVLGPVRAGAYLEICEQAGVAPPTTRATLDRLTDRGFLERERAGREVRFRVTARGTSLLREASERVHSDDPFTSPGQGWTLVTFSVPERQRTVRHRLRSTLVWEGFAPLRDGLWIAPGEIDLTSALAPLDPDLAESSVVAFRARDLPGYSVDHAVSSAWDLERIRAAHERFEATWRATPTFEDDEPSGAVATLTLLVADWLALLQADPRLPDRFLGADWPASRSVDLYRRRRADLDSLASSAIRALD